MAEINDELAQALTLQGRVAVITDAGSGLGQEAARIFSMAGAQLVLADVDEAGLAETVRLVGAGDRRSVSWGAQPISPSPCFTSPQMQAGSLPDRFWR